MCFVCAYELSTSHSFLGSEMTFTQSFHLASYFKFSCQWNKKDLYSIHLVYTVRHLIHVRVTRQLPLGSVKWSHLTAPVTPLTPRALPSVRGNDSGLITVPIIRSTDAYYPDIVFRTDRSRSGLGSLYAILLHGLVTCVHVLDKFALWLITVV